MSRSQEDWQHQLRILCDVKESLQDAQEHISEYEPFHMDGESPVLDSFEDSLTQTLGLLNQLIGANTLPMYASIPACQWNGHDEHTGTCECASDTDVGTCKVSVVAMDATASADPHSGRESQSVKGVAVDAPTTNRKDRK